MKKIFSIGIGFTVILCICLFSTVFAAEPVKITFASWQWHEVPFVDFYHEMNEKFAKENPGYVIEEQYTPFAKYFDKMLADTTAGAVPDLMLQRIEDMGPYQSMKALEPLDKWMSKTDIKSAYYSAQYQPPVKVNGKTYALVMGYVGAELFYNKELFQKAGLSVPKNPDEFVNAAIKLTKAPDQYGYACMTMPQVAFYIHLSYWIYGQDKDYLKKEYKVNTPGVIKALTYYKKLFDAKVMPMGIDKSVIRTLFAQGKAAMIIDGPGVMDLVKTQNPSLAPKIDTAVVPFPSGVAVAQNSVLTIPAKAKQKDMAWKYLEMINRPENNIRFLQITGCTTGRKLTDKQTADYLQENPWYTGFSGSAKNLVIPVGPTPEIDPQVSKIMIDAAQSVLYQNVPVKTALNDAQKQIDQIVASLKK